MCLLLIRGSEFWGEVGVGGTLAPGGFIRRRVRGVSAAEARPRAPADGGDPGGFRAGLGSNPGVPAPRCPHRLPQSPLCRLGHTGLEKEATGWLGENIAWGPRCRKSPPFRSWPRESLARTSPPGAAGEPVWEAGAASMPYLITPHRQPSTRGAARLASHVDVCRSFPL